MLLRYTGGGEVVPALGDLFVAKGEVVNVRSKAVEKLLIKTERFELIPKKEKPKPVTKFKKEKKRSDE